jgi:hypothetical protein
LMVELDNHATWCAGRGMNESYAELVRFVDLFSQATEAGISPRFAEIAKTRLLRGQSRVQIRASWRRAMVWRT